MKKDISKITSFEEFKKENKKLFANHVAKLTKLDGNDGKDCVIEFKENGTIEGSMNFTYINGVISISGDYGYAMFNWHNRANHILAYKTFESFGYVMEKMVASSKYQEFSSDLFENEFNSWKEQLIGEEYEASEINDIDVPYVEDENDVISYFKNFTKVDDLYEYGCYTFGTHLNWTAYARWYGLQEAIKFVENGGCFEKGE